MADETFTAFIGPERVTQGSRAELEAALAPRGAHPEGLLVFSDLTGRETDLDLSGAAPARGRPKLGVRAREVTLLPRHWDWLARQRGGASAALRRLVEEAMRAEAPGPTPDAAYRFLTAIAGNLPGYEAAIRALYAGEAGAFATAMTSWPDDIRNHALSLARLA
ncbi:DUF2239 family protein [Sinisalibacter aestuarii]|uniref:DUF2239 family protein n=1 Tax=Sinisalibacter aestuarii TaxID=2949426 RepID=A0ABQ5LVQ0_9RHOB|nr:DUF2239 family protein [Sinisalibacter aestuarii]GKY89069.1 hypothetical protein STA1M1_29380 [Sinisalibacter aestuarii]